MASDRAGAQLATVAVAQRRGTSRSEVEGAIREVPGGELVQFFEMPTIGLSSTMIRERVRAGEPIRYIVPDAVAHYIHEHNLYRG